MSLPRKKSRAIVVEGETWYWRTNKGIKMDEASKLRFAEAQRLAVEKNPELKGKRFGMMFNNGDLKYVKTVNFIATRTNDKPFMIKAEFENCERLLPKVAAEVIAYAKRHSEDSKKVVEITNATQIFEPIMAASDEKENSLEKIRYANYKRDASARHELEADRYISTGHLCEAIDELRSSIFYDMANSHKRRKLDRLIADGQASAKLFNHRAFAYYMLHRNDPANGHLEKGYNDVVKAVELDPGYAIAHGTLAEILYMMGDREGFYDSLTTALEKGMTQKIDGEINFELREEPRFLDLLDRFQKRDWIRHY